MICTMAKHAAEAKGCSDAMMFDYRGYVAEATGANIFFVKNGEVHTPKPDCFLNGITKNSFVSHMVNYTIAYLPAFQFFKKKILEKKIIIKEAELEWIIFNKSNNINWKNYHDKGGGILFNFYCHTLYYLELLFGDMHSTKVDINNKAKSKNNYVIGDIVFSSGLKVKIKILIGDLNKHKKSIHQLKVQTLKNEQFVLSSSTKNLSDQFQLHKIKNIKNLKYKKYLFTSKILKKDFRISPYLFNLKRFAVSIHKKKIDRSSFFTANQEYKK